MVLAIVQSPNQLAFLHYTSPPLLEELPYDFAKYSAIHLEFPKTKAWSNLDYVGRTAALCFVPLVALEAVLLLPLALAEYQLLVDSSSDGFDKGALVILAKCLAHCAMRFPVDWWWLPLEQLAFRVRVGPSLGLVVAAAVAAVAGHEEGWSVGCYRAPMA